MKRFHVHLAVENLETSTAFYSKLFGQQPTKQQPDYAKWMLDNPRLNFAISSRGHATGVNHFGFQADSVEELDELKQLADAASPGEVLDQGESACCYSKSEKHWTVDPQGIAWEHFHTLSDVLEFGSDTANQSGACCIPVHGSESDSPSAQAACCIPNGSSKNEGACSG